MKKINKKTIKKVILAVFLVLFLFKIIDNLTLNITKITYCVSGGIAGNVDEIVVDSFGCVREYANGYDSSSTPNKEWMIQKGNWNAMVTAIKCFDFIYLPDEIESILEMYDGFCYYIKIETNRGVYEKGGNEAGFGILGGNLQFRIIQSILESNIYSR